MTNQAQNQPQLSCDLGTYTNAKLVEFHNTFSGAELIKGKWNKPKNDLICRIQKLEGFQRPTIRAFAEAQLLAVVSKNDEGRNVGLPYGEILKNIHQAFPNGETSVKCLRWYAVKMKEDEKVLKLMPIRPRTRPAKES